eukprot:1627020-Pyramimonas_sp.AAC.1
MVHAPRRRLKGDAGPRAAHHARTTSSESRDAAVNQTYTRTANSGRPASVKEATRVCDTVATVATRHAL